jgi:DNA-directed RNA polymerase subunit A'
MSMMAHRVRVMPYKTFRLNLCITIPYGADFDGDEMNLHIPQTEESQVESKELMAAKKHLRSPRFSGPIIGAKIDHLTGLYLLTKSERKFKREEFVQLIRSVDPEVEIPDKATMTGKEIFSIFLPKDFSMETKSASGEKVIIKDGKLLEGVIDKAAVGAESGKILDEIEFLYGPYVANKFLFNVTKLGVEYLTQIGFSLSISDQDLPKEAKEEIKKIIEKTKKEVNETILKFNKGEIKHLIGRTPKESLEHFIKIILRNCLNDARKVLEKYAIENSMFIMANSGSRGSLVNIVQTSALVGQEFIMGERMDIGYYRRTFSHFKRDDISLETKGFVSAGFKDGLSPFEFFFDAMNSRESLMDKSLKTRHSGYMERRLIGALQDLKVEYDRTVRDSSGKIVQFVFGEDSLDPSKTEKGGVDVERIAERIFS